MYELFYWKSTEMAITVKGLCSSELLKKLKIYRYRFALLNTHTMKSLEISHAPKWSNDACRWKDLHS